MIKVKKGPERLVIVAAGVVLLVIGGARGARGP
jgi:hypothetical protein